MKLKHILLSTALMTGTFITGFALGKDQGKHSIPDPTVIETQEECCSITIDHAAKLVIYTTDYGGVDIEPYKDEADLDQIINQMQEHCYHNHLYEY